MATIAATVVARIVEVGVRAGVPAVELQRILGRRRDQLVDGARVPIERMYAAFERCLAHTADPGFPLRVAEAVSFEDYSVLGFALMTSRSAAEAFDRLARYGHLISDSGRWSAATGSDGVRIAWEREGARTLGHRAANECAVAELVGGLRRGYGPALAPLRVSFRHPAPADTRAHERFFGAPIRWADDRDAVELPAWLMSARPSTESPALSRFFGALLEERAAPSVAEQVRSALARGLPSGPPSAEQVAVGLGISERTLRRSLAGEGTTFRALLDELRRTSAVDLLATGRSVTEIAFLLGFSETSALSRAYRRWYGTSMRRSRALGDAGDAS